MESTWNPHGICMESMWNKSTWNGHGIHMESAWNPCGISPHGMDMEYMWIPYGIHSTKSLIYMTKHIPYGIHVESMEYIHSIWIPYAMWGGGKVLQSRNPAPPECPYLRSRLSPLLLLVTKMSIAWTAKGPHLPIHQMAVLPPMTSTMTTGGIPRPHHCERSTRCTAQRQWFEQYANSWRFYFLSMLYNSVNDRLTAPLTDLAKPSPEPNSTGFFVSTRTIKTSPMESVQYAKTKGRSITDGSPISSEYEVSAGCLGSISTMPRLFSKTMGTSTDSRSMWPKTKLSFGLPKVLEDSCTLTNYSIYSASTSV